MRDRVEGGKGGGPKQREREGERNGFRYLIMSQTGTTILLISVFSLCAAPHAVHMYRTCTIETCIGHAPNTLSGLKNNLKIPL